MSMSVQRGALSGAHAWYRGGGGMGGWAAEGRAGVCVYCNHTRPHAHIRICVRQILSAGVCVSYLRGSVDRRVWFC